MASESTVVSDHPTAPEQVEKPNEEMKKIEQEGLPPFNGGGEEEKPKAEALPSQTAPSCESEEKYKKIEPSIAGEVKKTDDAPVLDVSVKDKPDSPIVTDSTKSPPEDQPTIESVEKRPQEQPPVESVEKQLEEQPKMDDTSETSIEAVEKSEEQVEVLPVKESEAAVVVKDTENSEPEPKKEEIPEPVPKVDNTQQKQSEVAEQVEKELSGTDVIEGQSNDEVVESGKIELESEGKDVKTGEQNEEKKGIAKESDEPRTDKVEELSSAISPTEVTEKSLEGDITSRDIELIAKNGKESIKDEAANSVKTEKNEEEGKVDEVTTSTIKEPIEESQKSKTEAKGEETVQSETNLEKEKEAGDIAKPEVPTPESNEAPKDEVISVKPTSKRSNNIMAKVKQSLVKAKKAIIGKSPNSKTVSSETKSDVKDK
ncbi:hypothetical protein LOK49_LG03G03434 [Camellia lanceoleosa]|uniref:Uncharacterized protein n=1 Tax=Camellia lanceoleosa TaxID=1840588 RepID=A0ACC0IAN6_9ERIC|nr:hypothetical protein LOK49_LG03G03434 [Camellia lanceoleosa]